MTILRPATGVRQRPCLICACWVADDGVWVGLADSFTNPHHCPRHPHEELEYALHKRMPKVKQ